MRLFFGVLFLVLTGLCTQYSASAGNTQSAFRTIAMRLARDFSSGSKSDVVNCLSYEGVELTDRYIPPTDIRDKKIPGLLTVANVSPHRIIEDSYEVDPAEFFKSPYSPLINQARQLVRQSLGFPKQWVSCNEQARDKWHIRQLGPAIVGKVASGTYWYLYLRKERDTWKIWKFELDE